MEDYTELLLQISDVLREHNRVCYRSVNSIAPLPMSDEEAVKAIRDIVTPKGKWSVDCQCSNCKKYVDYTTDNCPNCGARME